MAQKVQPAAKAPVSGFPKKWIGLGIIVLIVLIFVSFFWGGYNNLVRLGQGVDESWANVETQYQRRVDLIPNLVATVEGYAGFEKSTLTEITALRSQWQTAPTVNAQVETANQIESAISKLLVISENYPDLKANQNFIRLQDSLTETENMVMVSRTRYNGAVRDYNTATKVFPSNLIANWFGFSERAYFAATTEGAQNVPIVDIQIP
jgi:LemA protein